ncbi:MAG TPA: hypothetical protein VG206_06230 [Terriglobia bacterium]|nr:hypothetical protein [Terriglobia bacterium]
MGPGDHKAKSLFIERFGDEGNDPQLEARSGEPNVADVPLRLTDERFAAEETRFQDFKLRTSSSSLAETTTLRQSVEAPARDLRAPYGPGREAMPEPGWAETETALPQRSKSAPAAKPRDLQVGVISHSHQKLHRSFLDADLHAAPTIDPRETASQSFKTRAARAASSARPSSGLQAVTVVLSLLLALVIGYGYLAMRQNNLSVQQLPGAQGVVSALRGPVDSGFRRAGAALEAAGDRTAEFLANAAGRFDDWRKRR